MSTLTVSIRKNYKALHNQTITCEQWWNFIAEVKAIDGGTELLKEITTTTMAAEKRLHEYKNSPLFMNKVRGYCNFHGYSDVEPYEVVKVISDRCVEIRLMDAELLTKMNFQVGGFSAHCVNNNYQEYKYTSNPANGTMRARLGKHGWKSSRGMHYMSTSPYKHYDYNF